MISILYLLLDIKNTRNMRIFCMNGVHLLPPCCMPCNMDIMLFMSIPPPAPPCIMLLNIDIGLGASLAVFANPKATTPTCVFG